MSLDNVVKVNITRQTKLPTRAGFGTPLIIDQNVVQTNRVDTFEDVAAMITAGFGSADQAVLAANALKAQNPNIPQFKVGRRDADVAKVLNVTVTNVTPATSYIVTINGTPFEFVSGGSPTVATIITGLDALINAGAEPVTSLDNTTDMDLTADVAGEDFSLVLSADLAFTTTTPNKNIVTELVEIRNADDDFYFILSTDRTVKAILDLAQTVETIIKLYGFATDEADSRDLAPASDTTSIFGQLNALNLDRTFGVWHDNPDLYAASRWVGTQAPKNAGESTWKFKDASGLTAVNLTPTQFNNITGPNDAVHKNANVYTTVGGVDIFEEGLVFSGEFIDTIRGTDELSARIQEGVFGTLLNNDKIPFTNGGIALMKKPVQDALDAKTGGATPFLASGEDADGTNLSPTVTAPDISAVPVAERAARFLDKLDFTARYAGAIHKTDIDGTISV